MIIDIDRLPKKGIRLERDFEFSNLEVVEEEAVFLEPVHAEVTVRREGDEVFIKGTVKTVISFVCSRCLVPYEYPLEARFDLVYLPEELEEPKEELDSQDLETSFYYSRRVDLKEVILEQLNLSFPVKPLCSEDCRGLCPVCGKDINSGACTCETETPDERLAKLKIFLKDKR